MKKAVPVALGAALLAVSLATRGLVPIDETRYAAVAWEMWSGGDWLVPHLNGATYSHKPPLLFWLVCLGWRVLGVSEVWLRIVPALFSLGGVLLCARVAARLWPGERAPAELAPWVLAGTGLWALLGTTLFFDPLIAFFTLLAALALLRAAQGRPASGWALFGAAVGLGILSKGPVVFLHALPMALLAPWWGSTPLRQRALRWYAGLAAALALAVAIALAWVIPAVYAGGAAYRGEILWGQTANRVVASFAHRKPFWFYLVFLPVIVFPWSVWPSALRGLAGRLRARDELGTRFCLAWAIPPLVLLSLVSGKQPQYLLPIVPAVALLVARGGGRGLRALAAGMVGVLALLHVAAMPQLAQRDLLPIARAIRSAQDEGRPVAHVGTYAGQYQFVGRLPRPLEELEPGAAAGWAREHPEGKLVVYAKQPIAAGKRAPDHAQLYRGQNVALWSSEAFLAAPELR